jgi:hypothetical protein
MSKANGMGVWEQLKGYQERHIRKIMTPRQLYEWVVVNILSVNFEYCTAEDHSKEMMKLEERFRQAQTLPGTQKIHYVIHASNNQVQTVSFMPIYIYIYIYFFFKTFKHNN